MENALEKWLETYFDEAQPLEFYRSIFGAGVLDTKGSFTAGKYVGICVGVASDKASGKPEIVRKTLTDELDAVVEACESDYFYICSPISYAGKRRTAENARYLFAIAVDVDKVRVKPDGDPIGLRNLYNAQVMRAQYLPKPTFIVSSGTGLHLYYVLEQPIPLYKDIVRELQIFKHELTSLIWNSDVCDIHDRREVQQEGIFQGMRMPGTITKNGNRARAFETGERVSMEYLNSFVRDKYRVQYYTEHDPKRLTLEKAKELYPEWYERRVVNGEPRGTWHINRALYEWWKEKIRTGAVVGHRYWCLTMLAVYARKCSYHDEKKNPQPVTLEELTRDAWELMEIFEQRTETEDNHFGKDDVLDALEAFDDRYILYPRAAIEFKSGIPIPETKRNGRKQTVHLRIARMTKEILKEEGTMKPEGRPTKWMDVLEWRAVNPYGTKAECARQTGIDPKTIRKYWREGGTK